MIAQDRQAAAARPTGDPTCAWLGERVKVKQIDGFAKVRYLFLTYRRTSKMKHIATVTSKGQITIPLAVRKRLGLKQGDQLEFINEGGTMVVRPVRGNEDPLAAYVGILGTFPGGIEEINAWVRDMRDDDEQTEDADDELDTGKLDKVGK
jgi:antitoxin PrlF